MKDKVIFGLGMVGTQALNEIGEENVKYFISNSPDRWGKLFLGIEIISPENFLSLKEQYHVVIASNYVDSMVLQLKEMGVTNYSVFKDPATRRVYETDELVFNQYETKPEAGSEAEWSSSKTLQYHIENVRAAVKLVQADKLPLFTSVEVETINRCNGVCSFCPINSKVDPREKKIMSKELFYSIVDQLADLNYSGRFSTFSNNEPLLDDRIIEFNQYARKRLPKAKFHLYTNGTLLTLDKFKALIEELDELIIDNYQQDLKLIGPCKEIEKYCETHKGLNKKVTILLRKPHEILTSRGGNAPNRQQIEDYSEEPFVLPFRQLVIRPDGKISLCCNDALGESTLGNLTKESVVDIWYGERYRKVREQIAQGRKNYGKCRYCDTFNVY